MSIGLEKNTYITDLFSITIGSLEAIINYNALKCIYWKKGIIPIYTNGKPVTEFHIDLPKKMYCGVTTIIIKGYNPNSILIVESRNELAQRMVGLCKVDEKYPIVLDEYRVLFYT